MNHMDTKEVNVVMICPQCEEGTLKKIVFIKTQKMAYLCNSCMSFWFVHEHIGSTAGHSLTEEGELFLYLKEADEEQQGIEDDRERIEDELSR